MKFHPPTGTGTPISLQSNVFVGGSDDVNEPSMGDAAHPPQTRSAVSRAAEGDLAAFDEAMSQRSAAATVGGVPSASPLGPGRATRTATSKTTSPCASRTVETSVAPPVDVAAAAPAAAVKVKGLTTPNEGVAAGTFVRLANKWVQVTRSGPVHTYAADVTFGSFASSAQKSDGQPWEVAKVTTRYDTPVILQALQNELGAPGSSWERAVSEHKKTAHSCARLVAASSCQSSSPPVGGGGLGGYGGCSGFEWGSHVQGSGGTVAGQPKASSGAAGGDSDNSCHPNHRPALTPDSP